MKEKMQENDCMEPDWCRCSIRYLLAMMLLKRVDKWEIELFIWPRIKWLTWLTK